MAQFGASRISPYPVPSFSHWRWNMPRMQVHDQHKAVYYATVASAATQRREMLSEKRRVLAVENGFRGNRERLLTAQPRFDATASALGTAEVRRAALSHAVDMHRFGLHDVAAGTVDSLVRNGKLSADGFARLIDGLGAAEVVSMLAQTAFQCDHPRALKAAADWSGHSRARTAAQLLEAAQATGVKLSAVHFNALMTAYLSCGFTEAQRIHTTVYDTMGARSVQPNTLTYVRVMQALCLTGNPQEAQSIFNFLKAHHPDAITSQMYETMMWGWREQRDYQRCDELWSELTMSPIVTPTVAAAEHYIRAILALARTPVTKPSVQFGQHNEVERKRIPGVLHQLQTIGIPASEICPPLWIECVSALRKYQISQHAFYKFGRSTQQFAFLEHRRRMGVIHDVREINPTVIHAPVATSEPGMGQINQAELPAELSARPVWETMPLQPVLNFQSIDEVNDRSFEKFREVSKSIHERSANWMSEVPETRYDKLYAVGNPNMAKMGIRRLLAGDHANSEEVRQRDRRVMERTSSVARRVRLSVERQRTHRDE